MSQLQNLPSGASGPSPMDGTEAALWQAVRDHADADARSRLMQFHLPYARIVAATYYARRTHNDVGFDDYLQLASMGLVESVDRFDPSHGVQFRTFAARRMHGAILDGLERSTEKNQQIAVRRRLERERVEAAKHAAEDAKSGAGDKADKLFRYLSEVGVGLALGILLEGTGMVDTQAMGQAAVVASPEVSYFRRTELERLQQLMRNLIEQLSVQERTVIRLHYLQGHPFDEICTHMDLSKGRISQIHRGALVRLRSAMSGNPLCDLSL